MPIAFKSVDDYIASKPEEHRELLERVRRTILQSLQGAEEAISYNIPAYKIDSKPVLYFSGWKNHYALYPVTAALKKKFAKELRLYEVEKGTIRFAYAVPVPVKLIAAIAEFRAGEMAGPTGGVRRKR